MKKRASNKKEVLKTKLKKTKTLAANRRTKQNVPDPWKEIGKKLKPIGKAYNKFIEKRKVAKQKEELKKLKDENRINGTVKWFNMSKGYGFIRREGEKKDIFVHLASVQHSGLKYLKEGEELTFEIEYNDKGPSAINLQKVVNEVSHSYLKVIK